MSVNEDIRDDLVSHDIDLRKLDGDTRNKVDKMLDKMEQELKMLLVKIDPFTPTLNRTRNARFTRLIRESAQIVKDTYAAISKFINERGQRLVVAESAAVTKAIHDNIPETS